MSSEKSLRVWGHGKGFFLFTGIKVIGQWDAFLCEFVTTTWPFKFPNFYMNENKSKNRSDQWLTSLKIITTGLKITFIHKFIAILVSGPMT